MTPEERAELRRLADAATNTPWVVTKDRADGTAQVYATHDGPMRRVVPVCETTPTDGAFIAAAREAVPALLDEVERLEALLEWEEGGTRRQQCPRCGAGNPAQAGYYCRMCGSLLTAERAPESAATLAAERDAFREAIAEALRQVDIEANSYEEDDDRGKVAQRVSWNIAKPLRAVLARKAGP